MKRTYSVRVVSVHGHTTTTLDAPSSESAALRSCQDTGAPRHAHAVVAMHVAGDVVEVATYGWDGRDVTLAGRPSEVRS